MNIQESGEMYLETIYVLSLEGKKVRAVDVSRAMSFSKPSVSRAVNLLKGDGYITVSEGGDLQLTPHGKETAVKIYERHRIITEFLTSLGVCAETAAADACRIEHVISSESFEALKAHASEKQTDIL